MEITPAESMQPSTIETREIVSEVGQCDAKRISGAGKGTCQILARTASTLISDGMFVKLTHDCFVESQNVTHEQPWVKLQVEIESLEANNLDELMRTKHETFAALCRRSVPQE
jgi:hypothetical protein